MNRTMLSIDPGFSNLGLVICEIEGQEIKKIIKNVTMKIFKKDPGEKMPILQKEMEIIKNMNTFVSGLCKMAKYDIILIEMQIGKFAAIQIQILLVAMFMKFGYDENQIVLIHPCHKMKYKIPTPDIKPAKTRKEDSNKYNQNKKQVIDVAKQWIINNGFDCKLDNHQADSLVQLLQYLRAGSE